LPLQATVNKTDVATAFSRSATTYDAAADLQRQIADKLLGYIPSREYSKVVDVGCGTGYSTQLLSNNISVESLVGLDIAEGMVSYARQKSRASFCCADAEQLPFRNQCIDLLFSSLALQWCPTLSAVLDEAGRVLTPKGRYIFSTLGPGTLFELQTAWKAVDKYVHVNYFAESALIEQLAQKSGFRVQIHQQTVVRQYHHLNELMSELKCLGVNNINTGRPTGLTGRQRLLSLRQHYEQFRNSENLLPASYLVYFVILEKDS
jgi:malonyl-CoA O-methyltransferase